MTADNAALIISIAAFAVSFGAVLYARRSALAAERQAKAAEAALPPPPPAVSWRPERRKGGLIVFRNIGTSAAEDVRIDRAELYGLATQHFRGTVAAGATFEIRMFQSWGDPDIHEIPLTWQGQNEPVLVPLPPPLSTAPDA